MRLTYLLSLFILLYTSSIFACDCIANTHFNLVQYDFYTHIFEVKIEAKYEPKRKIKGFDIDTLQPPPAPYEFDFFDGYTISMIEVFKGDPANLSENIMSFANNSSCSWQPEVGKTYIFYATGFGGIDSCNRKLIKKNDNKAYEEEKSILRVLKNTPDTVHITSGTTPLIKGAHINGKRDGVWNIYSGDKKNKLMLTLTYKKGALVAAEKGPGYNDEKEWHGLSYDHFKKQLGN